MQVNNLLKTLISIPSETGKEKEVCNFIFNLLKKEGFSVVKTPVEKNRFNIIAKIGKPKVFLQAHLDTVPPFIKYSEDKNYIYGRGACDTKASAAAMITASLELVKSGIKDFGLIFTVGEEVDFAGVKKLSKYNFPFVIVGEPTSLKAVNAHFGILVFKITAKGKAAHSSLPKEGVNAINLLLEGIKGVNKIKIFPESILTLAKIEGGIADNIIPETASALYSMRISPKDKKDYIKEFKKILPKTIKIRQILNVPPVKNKIPNKLSFLDVGETLKGSTELSYLKQGIILGPGDIKYAHGQNEKIDKKELGEAVRIYSKIIENYC